MFPFQRNDVLAMPTEADARIVVDRLLRQAGWDIEDKSQVSTEEAAADGRADYLLKNQRTQPLAPIETKRFSVDPYSAKEQARDYAISLAAPFVILSNGREHYFWEYETGDAHPVVGLPSRADLERRANLRQHRSGSLETILRALPYGQAVKRGIGDRLSPAQWEFLQRGTLHIFEADKDIIRMAAMNAVLHGFDHSPIVRRDSIGGGEDKWDEIQFDCILENPPFSGAGLAPKRSLRVEKGEKYVLFLAAALRSLRPGGRAGIVLPNGILFGDTTVHLEVKKRLLAEFDLQAVVTLPKGMFEPYTPNPTCFLIFQKTGKPTKETWFYRVEGDGSSLKKARKFGPQFRNDFPDLLAKWPKRKTEEGRAWRVPAAKVIANGYNMTLASLGLVEPEKTDHAEPEDILESVAAKEERILALVAEMKGLLENPNP